MSNIEIKRVEWSEEDEITYNEILDFFLGNHETRCVTIDKQRSFGYWIRSLKDRILLQPKQGEQKETPCDKCRKKQPSHPCQDISELERCAVEHEQKSIDKVKLKYKVGDWIVNKQGEIARINQIKKDSYGIQRYYIEFTNGAKTDPMPCCVDENSHLWTIQDAKDGDVLYSKNSLTGIEFIVMNRGINGYGHIDSYFRYNSEDGFGINIPSVFTAKVATPATKEQRDFLFQKMHEAGYEWNAEKKLIEKRLMIKI